MDNMNERVEDPVCGMVITKASADISAEIGGKAYFFCCLGCHEKLKADPAKYAERGHKGEVK